MAKELKIPVLALAALNREVEKSGKIRTPKMSDIRDCGNIESDADNIVFLHRDGIVGENDEESYETTSPVQMILAKQRGGRGTGVVNLTFDGPRTRFDERNASREAQE